MSAADVAAWSDPVPSLPELGAVHFVGIGGAGMSGIARILLARGVRVSGSDRRDTPTLLALRALGARVSVGHDPANLGDADTVVVSTAIRADTPELAAARERELRVLPRAVALAAVMAGRRSVAVAGTPRKTPPTPLPPRGRPAGGGWPWRARTGRPPPPRCSPWPSRPAAWTRRSPSAATSTSPEATRTPA